MPTSVQPAEYDMRPPVEYSSRSPITAREARVGCISQSSPPVLSPAKICASQAPVMQPPEDFLPPWHAPPSAKNTSAPPVEPDDATISAMRARMQNVRREIAGLRSKYPELDWTFVGEDLTPPVWPPEMPRARTADPAKSKRSDAPGRTANGGVSPTPRQKGAVLRSGHPARASGAPEKPLLVRMPMCRGPGYRPLSANRSGPAHVLAGRFPYVGDVDPIDATPGPGQYDVLAHSGMTNRPCGPSYQMRGRLKTRTGYGLAFDSPGPGQYDISKY